MIKMLLYINILNICLSLYIGKYLSIKFREKMDNTLPQELDSKKRQKVYDDYHAIICILEILFLFISLLLPLVFLNINSDYEDIIRQGELITWANIVDYILASMFGISLVISIIRDLRQQKKATKTYNIDYSRSLFGSLIVLRTYSYPTFFLTLVNLVDLCLYRHLLSPSTFIYYFYVALFLFIMLSIQWIKPIDKLFREQNIFKTILLLIAPILIAFCIDYFWVV